MSCREGVPAQKSCHAGERGPSMKFNFAQFELNSVQTPGLHAYVIFTQAPTIFNMHKNVIRMMNQPSTVENRGILPPMQVHVKFCKLCASPMLTWIVHNYTEAFVSALLRVNLTLSMTVSNCVVQV